MMIRTSAKRNKIVLRCLVVLGLSIGIVKSCTSPDAVYALMQPSLEKMETISYMGTIYDEQKLVVYPEEIIEKDGNRYRLVSTELKEVPVEGTWTYISAIIPYELEGEMQPPEMTVMTLSDERTKEMYQRQVECLSVEEKGTVWKNTFEFPITISDADAEVFWLDNLEISGNEELSLYGTQFLEMLGLSEAYYRVDSIEWNGDYYEKEGVIYRDAIGKGEKKIRFVDATYGAQIRTPDTVGYRYESVYEKMDDLVKEKKDKLEETLELNKENSLNTFDPEMSFFNRIKQLIQEHLIMVSVSFLFIIVGFGCAGVLFFSKNKKNPNESIDT